MVTASLDELFSPITALTQNKLISEEEIKWLASIEEIKRCDNLYISLSWNDTLLQQLTISCPNIQRLDLSFTSITTLSPLSSLKHLSALVIDNSGFNYLLKRKMPITPLTKFMMISNSPISDLTPLSKLQNLTTLSLDGSSVTDLSPLSGLSALALLSLDDTPVKDLSPLANLSQLTDLSLDSTNVSDLSPLIGLSRLTNLSLDFTYVYDISPLSKLSHLSHLSLDCTYLEDLSPITTLTSLTKLFLTVLPPDQLLHPDKSNGSRSIESNLSCLSELSQLTDLTILGSHIRSLAPIANLTNLTSLNLYQTSLSDISPLSNLTNLQELTLFESPVEDLSPLANLTHLTSLTLSGFIATDFSVLGTLTQLTELSITGHPHAKDFSSLSTLDKLTSLSLSNTSVADLSFLSAFNSLTTLSLNNSSIEDLSQLEKITNLVSLSLDNTFVDTLSPLSGLYQLNYLSVDGTAVEDLSALAGLERLEQLSFDNTFVQDLTPLTKLVQINHLSLAGTRVKDISPIAGLTQLITLSLDNTDVSDLSPAKSLSGLIALSLDNTDVTDLAPINTLSLCGLSIQHLHLREISRDLVENTKKLIIAHTSVDKQPSALFTLPKEQILSYYDQKKVPAHDGKVIFLGESGVGKTHTIQRILKNGEKIVFSEKSTQGVKIYPYSPNQTTVNFWDFGGQDIQQSMHQCFLTERTCYVVVISNRDPERAMPEAEKWLRTISIFSKQVSVLLLVNCWSEVPFQNRINDSVLRDICPRLSDNIIYYSAKDDDQYKFQTVIDSIMNEVYNLEFIQLEIPENWASVRNELIHSKENYISMEDYLKLCSRHSLGGNNRAMVSIRQWLLKWFNDLGICFSYYNVNDHEKQLADYKVLKPDWLTNGIYRLILWGHVFSGSGIISREDINEILFNKDFRVNGVETDYNSFEAGYILEVMRKFGRSYPESQDKEFIPDLLDAKRPDCVEPKDYAYSFTYTCELTWLPRVLLHRLMIALREWGTGTRWLTGFCLKSKNAFLLITGEEKNGVVRIKLFTNDIDQFVYPFHEARLLLLAYAEEMGINVDKELIGYSSTDFELENLIWDYCENNNNLIRVNPHRGGNPERIPLRNLLTPFFNHAICITTRLLSDKNNNPIQSLNAAVSVYPYCSNDIFNKIKMNNSWDHLITKINAKYEGQRLSPLAMLAALAIEDHDFVQWLKENGTLVEEVKEMHDSNIDETKLQGINKQLYCWASTSDLYKKATGEPDLDTLAKALGPNETERYKASISVLESIWKHHPELGLMPDYSFLSKKEHEGAYYSGYRDHLTHMLKVYILGLFLYESDSLIQTSMTAKEEFFSVWTLSALWHDVGYLIETEDGARDSKDTAAVFDRFNEKLKYPLANLFSITSFRDNEPIWQKNHSVYPDLFESLTDCEDQLSMFASFGESVKLSNDPGINPIMEYFTLVSQKHSPRPYFDHGIISAALLLFTSKSLCKYMESSKDFEMYSDEAEKRDGFLSTINILTVCAQKAAIAIALHNITKPDSEPFRRDLIRKGVTISNFSIDIEKEPFSWLLRVCDELQCWDRQRFIDPLQDSKPSVSGDALQFDKITFGLQFENPDDKEKIISALKSVITPLPSFL